MNTYTENIYRIYMLVLQYYSTHQYPVAIPIMEEIIKNTHMGTHRLKVLTNLLWGFKG